MDDLQARKNALLAQLATADEPPPLLHPSMGDLYRSKVEELASALQREDTRLEALDKRQRLRRLLYTRLSRALPFQFHAAYLETSKNIARFTDTHRTIVLEG